MLRSLLDYDGQWTPREVLALIQWLPDDSALRASHAGGTEYIGWSTRTWQLKHLYDAMQNQTVLMYRLQMGKKAKKVKPDKFPTPSELVAKAKSAAKKKAKDVQRSPTVSMDKLSKLLTGK